MELFSPGHLIPLLIVVAILFFGWKQLPDMARSVGRSLRIFKTEMKGLGDDDQAREAARTETPPAEQITAPPAAAAPAPPAPAAAPVDDTPSTSAATAPARSENNSAPSAD